MTSHFSEDPCYGIFYRLPYDISSPFPLGLGAEISVQGAARRSASSCARDHSPSLR
ncbi:hypothetical protein SPHV1_2100002 [Novosphingobium sp. KN65.2]|nr:hypothetical protein SPHV1_2100002 [Novosphingobium sp. KN65.2]